MKRRLLSIIMALVLCLTLLPTAALADEDTQPVTFTNIDGTAGAATDEGSSKLFDGNSGTKWCVTGFNNDGAYVIFEASSPMQVGGYSITTGNDNNINPGRNPKDWVLYGSTATTAPTRNSGSWEVIHEVTNDKVLQDENLTTYNFTLDNPKATEYKYFKLEITAVQNIHDTNIMQISEFVLTSCNHNWETVIVPGTKDELGYTTKTCTICHQAETQYDLTNAMTLVLSNNSSKGWGGAELQIHRDGQLWKNLTLENDRNSQTVYLPYSEDSNYSFYWKKDDTVSDNIVLDILFGINKVFTSNNLNSAEDGALLFQLNTTLTVPFTTTVKLGGNTAPGETVFNLAVVQQANTIERAYANVTVSASVTTNGAGSYEGTMTLKGSSFEQLCNMLRYGVFVQQVNAGAPNWTYDDTVWGLCLRPDVVEFATDYDDNDDTAPEYTVLVLPTVCKKTDDGVYYELDLNAKPVERMSFTNTYTYSAPVRDTTTIIIGGEKEENKPVEENPNTGAPVAANMSTLSVLVLASAVAVLKTRKH